MSKSKLSSLCDGLLEAGWLVALVAIPLFFNIHSERVFEPDKITLLRSLALAMAFTWLVRFIDQRGWKNLPPLRWRDEDSFWRRPFVLPFVAIIFVYLISTIFSITPRVSLLGSYQRLQGTYTTLSYLVIAAVAASSIRSRAQIGRIITAIIVTSIPVAFYGLLQHFGLDPLPWGGDVQSRVAGHMGNAIFIAAYLIMTVPLTLGRIVDAFTNILSDEQLSFADVIRSAIYIFILVIQLLAIYWSGSRGPLIGLAVALFSFILLLLVTLRNVAEDKGAFKFKDFLWAVLLVIPAVIALLLSNLVLQAATPLIAFVFFFGFVFIAILILLVLVAARIGWKWLWLSWLLLTTFVAGWLLLFNVPSERMEAARDLPVVGPVLQTQIAWKELPTIGSYGRMLDPSQTVGRERSNRVRVLIWQGVVDLVSPHAPLAFPDGRTDSFNFLRPLIGYGPESMYVVYNPFYPPELATVEARNASPDRSHNETFDALVITGLFGLIAWQALYLSVFYYGFRYLGVVRTKRDRYFLLGGWIGGALLGALLSVTIFDPIYLGVAIPLGTIVGLILYLFYYAIFARPGKQDSPSAEKGRLPFQVDRLLMNALIAAVIAHYVEIHFGIAIAVTRLHFFILVALIYAISYKLPKLQENPQKAASASQSNDRGSVWLWTFLLAILVGILGYNFVNYVLPPGMAVNTGADLSAADIFQQSLFVNTIREFQELPFIFMLIILSWAVGSLLILAEMVKQGVLDFSLPKTAKLPAWRQNAAVAILAIIALVMGLARFIGPAPQNASSAIGQNLALLGAIIALWGAVSLLFNANNGRFVAMAVASGGLVFALPLLFAGSYLYALALGLSSIAILFLLWHKNWRRIIWPPIVLTFVSLLVGLAFTYIHAINLREALLYLVFFQQIEPVSLLYTLFFYPTEDVTSVARLRVLEALQAERLLANFYLYLFTMWFVAGLSLAWGAIKKSRAWGTITAYVAWALLLGLAVFLISQTNMNVVQADMVYKRAKPFEQEATQLRDPLSWNVAVGIYEEALKRVPLEDFYYLFLGRAVLERSTLEDDSATQAALLDDAQRRLLEAQAINPLNTDHTANLARLATRWVAANPDAIDSQERLEEAKIYYQKALALSPQNSVIRNEYARLFLDFEGDCDQAIAIYDESIKIDPYYLNAYYGLTDTLVKCASAQTDPAVQQEMYELAVASLSTALGIKPDNPRAWLQLGQLYDQIGQPQEALAAYQTAREMDITGVIGSWNFDFLEAGIYDTLGDPAMARALAEQALLIAPADVVPSIEAFLDGLPE